jgi:hypothetical protein
MTRTGDRQSVETEQPPAEVDHEGRARPDEGGDSQAALARSSRSAAHSARSLVLAFVAGGIVATVIFSLLGSSNQGSPYKARQYYDRIQPGMTRAQVKRLMLPSYAMYSTIEWSDIMILDERFMIAVTYGPKPPNPAPPWPPFGQPNDDWVVTQKLYVDHLRRNWLENVATALRIRPERVIADRVR